MGEGLPPQPADITFDGDNSGGDDDDDADQDDASEDAPPARSRSLLKTPTSRRASAAQAPSSSRLPSVARNARDPYPSM